MRYQKIKITHNTVFDDEIKEIETIRNLMSLFVSSHVDLIIEWNEPLNNPRMKLRYDHARILSFENDIAKIKEVQGNASFIRDIKLEQIVLIRLVSEKHNIMVGNEEINRFDLMDMTIDEKHENK